MDFTTGILPNSNVLIKPRFQNDKIKFSWGGEFYLDTKFLEMEHTDIIADVIKVPNKVIQKDNEGIPREYPVEIQPGDQAFCHYLAISNCLKRKGDGRKFIHNGELYLILGYYGNIFMVIRDGKPIMVNDYILIEHNYHELRELEAKTPLGIPEQVKEFYTLHTHYGIIRYVGENLSPEIKFNEELTVGREVFFAKNADIPLEYSLHQTFEKGKKLFRIKRRDVLMVF